MATAGVECQVAAVHRQQGAGDRNRRVRAQEDGRADKVFGVEEAAEGNADEELPLYFLSKARIVEE